LEKNSNMVEIKDLAGLGEPLKRLVEVVGEGIGAVSRPFLTRLDASAKASEVRKIATAVSDSQKLLPGSIKYEAGKITIESSNPETVDVLPDATIEQRVISRIAYQEAKRQANIENIVGQAAKALGQIDSVASEKPNIDWTARFFRIAEDINTEHMQLLWGKVLAGEITRPGSYSLRTLDLLRNITQEEAELFVKAARRAFVGDQNRATFLPHFSEDYLKERYGLGYDDLMSLEELGLLFTNPVDLRLKTADEKRGEMLNRRMVFATGNTAVMIYWPGGCSSDDVPVVAFTKAGIELLQLVEKLRPDPDYIENFASHFRSEGVVIKVGPFTRTGDHGEIEIDKSLMTDLSQPAPKAEP
jgi:uncharacterized repeat protein (TIGR03899 family)